MIEGENRMVVDLSVRCFRHTHWMYSMYFGIPAIVLWILGIPFLSLAILYKHRKKLDDQRVTEMFSFLYFGYAKNRYYWEVVIMYRKVFIIVISVFLKRYGVIT